MDQLSASPPQAVWLAEPAPLAAPAHAPALTPTIAIAAIATAGLLIVAAALAWRRARKRKSQSPEQRDADRALAKLARELGVARSERAQLVARAQSLRVHPVGLLIVDTIEQPSLSVERASRPLTANSAWRGAHTSDSPNRT